jgi:hypothetical protein
MLTASTEALSLITRNTMQWAPFDNQNKALLQSIKMKCVKDNHGSLVSSIYKLVLVNNTFQQALNIFENRLKQTAQFQSTSYNGIAPAVYETDIAPLPDFYVPDDLPALHGTDNLPAFDETNILTAFDGTDTGLLINQEMADNQNSVLQSEYDYDDLHIGTPQSAWKKTENDIHQEPEESDVDNSSFSAVQLQHSFKYTSKLASIHVAQENRFSDFLHTYSNYPNTLFIVVLSYFGDIEDTIHKILQHKDSADVKNSVQLSLFKHTKLSSLVLTMRYDDCCEVHLKLDNSENPIDLWLISQKMSENSFDMSAILETASMQKEIYNTMFMPSCTANGKQILDNLTDNSDYFYLQNCLLVIVSVSNDFDFKDYGGRDSFTLVLNTLHERAISNPANSSGAEKHTTKQKAAGNKKQPSSSTRKSVEIGICHGHSVRYLHIL